MVAAEIPGLPPIKHIAAGQQHALLSDGERVWAIGTWVGSTGEECGNAHWSNPQVGTEVGGVLVLVPGAR